ncbi:MAG: integrase family protein [Zoogloeaceae bacterium]|nr:integrase family protein [Rhodocyclaceae bacterium]MCP5236743.1 integrase family protein [Zoogloeaceae bacterium]
MSRERLTPTRIADFNCPEGKHQVFRWDSEMPRLAVRATRASKSFVFESKLDRSTIRVTIGAANVWTLADARAEARRLQTLIDQGKDPRDEKRERQAAREARRATEEAARKAREQQERYTLRALCDAYIGHLEAAGKLKSSKDAASLFRCHLPSDVADLPARGVTARLVAELVRTVREAGKERTAGKLRSYLFAAYRAAVRAPFDARLPAALIPFEIEANPVEPVAAIPVKAGNRVLSSDELKAYIGHLGNSIADRVLLVSLLAGGQRIQQLLRAKPADFDPTSGTLRLFDPKGKRAMPREHLLPLAPRAAAMVGELARRAVELQAPLIFSSYGTRPMSGETLSKRAREVCTTMGGERFDLKDIRRTCETMLAELGISRDTRAQLLSHGIGGVQDRHYDRHGYVAEKRAALEAWEARIASIEKGGPVPSNVRPLRKGKATVGR